MFGKKKNDAPQKDCVYYQQGDIIFRATDARPGGGKARRNTNVVADGELTGHAHRIEDATGAVLYADREEGEVTFIEARNALAVVHEEHKRITLPPGNYIVDRVKEYDHVKEVTRRVMD